MTRGGGATTSNETLASIMRGLLPLLERLQSSYFKMSLTGLVNYFAILTVSFHDVNALYGFFLLLVVMSQLISGTMLSFSLIPEPMLVPIVRDEEDLEDLYTDDFFWIHERGVDLLFVFS